MTTSRAFEAYYDGDKAFFNKCENRIRILDERLEKGIKPWEWDYERYGGKNSDMVGFFYEDDLANLAQIDAYKREFAAKHRQQK